MVFTATIERLNIDSVMFLPAVVLFGIIYDHGLRKWSAQLLQILNKEESLTVIVAHLSCVLSVEPVLDTFGRVNLINHLVSILLLSSRKHNKFVVVCHLCQEFSAERSCVKAQFRQNL